MTAIDAAVASLHESIDGLFPSVFVLEHGHLWLVAQRGYAVVPDGIGVEQGVLGRAVRHGRGQFVIDVHSDPDYLEVLPAVASEATVPLRVDRVTVGVLNLDSERPLPETTLKLLRPLAVALAPKTATLRASGRLDLPALARLFVYLGSLRDPNEIAALASASFARVLRLEASQVWMWDEVGRPVELASWVSDARRGAADRRGARHRAQPRRPGAGPSARRRPRPARQEAASASSGFRCARTVRTSARSSAAAEAPSVPRTSTRRPCSPLMRRRRSTPPSRFAASGTAP